MNFLSPVVKFCGNIINMPNQAILFLQNGKSQNVGYPLFPLTPSIFHLLVTICPLILAAIISLPYNACIVML